MFSHNCSSYASFRGLLLGVCSALVIGLAAPSTSHAQERSPWAEGGLGVGAVIVNLVYTPAKLIVAGGGALAAGIGYAVTGGRREVVGMILNPALRGDYVITPEHLLGERRLVFIGPYEEDLQDPEPEVSGGNIQGESGQGKDERYPF